MSVMGIAIFGTRSSFPTEERSIFIIKTTTTNESSMCIEKENQINSDVHLFNKIQLITL